MHFSASSDFMKAVWRLIDYTPSYKVPSFEQPLRFKFITLIISNKFGAESSTQCVISEALREKKRYGVFEVTCVKDGGGIRRINIAAIDSVKKKVLILDPTVHFEDSTEQPEL